jgi:hypothetical protein
MLAAYRERATIKNVMEAGGVGKRVARRAVMEGWPDHNLPPFVELASSGTSVHKEMARIRESWEDAATTQGEAARMAAEQAMAARVTMDSALQATRLSQKLAVEMMEKLERGECAFPDELTPKVVQQVVRSLDTSAAIVEKAIKIEKMRTGEPEAQLGIQIGIMLERCNEDELEIVIKTGHLPDRLLDQRRLIVATPDEAGNIEEARALGELSPEEAAMQAPEEADEDDEESFGMGLPDGLDLNDDDEPKAAAGS